MATAVRNTGTRFRYDADDQRWHAKVRVATVSSDGEKFSEFVEEFITLVQLIAWLIQLFDGMALSPDTTVAGHDETGYSLAAPDPP